MLYSIPFPLEHHDNVTRSPSAGASNFEFVLVTDKVADFIGSVK